MQKVISTGDPIPTRSGVFGVPGGGGVQTPHNGYPEWGHYGVIPGDPRIPGSQIWGPGSRVPPDLGSLWASHGTYDTGDGDGNAHGDDLPYQSRMISPS